MDPHVKSDASTSLAIERVVLAGFMGSGKSTVGRLLAARLRWRFADLDDSVATRKGLSVPAIFAQQGEASFRFAETEALQELLLRSRLVIALGGGAPETPALRSLLRTSPRTTVVHLDAPFATLYDRCVEQARDSMAVARPLLAERDAAEQRYTRRLPLYAHVAHHAVAVADLAPQDVVETILAKLPCR